MDKDNKLNIYGYAGILKAIAHPVRLKIVCGLSKKDMCSVGKIAECLSIPQPTVSQHLNILKNAGIVSGYRKGTQVCYKLTSVETVKILNSIDIDF